MNESTERPSFGTALRFWLKLGFISFGGPAGQIAIMHSEVVERRKWVTEGQFLHSLNFCMILPGPEAQQLATYLGWKMHGVKGGLAAGILFVLPSALLLWGLSWISLAQGQVPWIKAIFHGLQPAVMAIIMAAVLRIGQKTLKRPAQWAIAGLSFVLLFFLKLPFPLVLFLAAAAGLIEARVRGGERKEAVPVEQTQAPSFWRTSWALGLGIILWWMPTVLAGVLLGWESIFVQQGLFFGKAALVTFGGAYAVLPYVAQQAVEHFGWLQTSQMMTGLGLAETTPGPLIMVLQYVGFVGAWQHPGGLTPLAAGTLGAAITTWTTFTPSFLFIFAAAPYIERLRGKKWFGAAMSAITAAVVGVILNLAIWFLIHMLFPGGGTFDALSLVATVVLFFCAWKRRWSAPIIVLAGAAFGLIAQYFPGL